MPNPDICARCGKPITNPQPGLPDQEAFYCSFRCEVGALFGAFKPGLRWFVASLAWAGALGALLIMVSRIILGHPISDRGSYYGLVVVLLLLTGILSLVWRRVSKE